MQQPVAKYTKTAIILHGVVGLLLIGMLVLGAFMHEVPKDLPKVDSVDFMNLGIYTVQFSEALTPRSFYFNLHKSIGITVFALILIRLFWRMTHSAPAFPATMKAWEKTVAELVHKALYFLMLAMPVSGIVMATYSKYGIKWFGIPLIKGLDNEGLREIFQEVHEVLAWTLVVLIVLHALAAIKHKLVDKDDVMSRMSLRG